MPSTWSTQSQRRTLELGRLRKEFETCELLLASLRKRCDEVEGIFAGAISHAAQGIQNPFPFLPGAPAAVHAERLRGEFFEKHRKELAEKIARLEEQTVAEAEGRREGQNSLARLAQTRLEKDGEVERAFEQVRRVLQERAELTRQMLVFAEAIDFSADASRLDSVRFEEFLERLPGEIVPQSRAWMAWFLGADSVAERYRVVRRPITLPETLTSAHVYSARDIVHMTAQQAGEIDSAPRMGSDRPAIEKVQEEKAVAAK